MRKVHTDQRYFLGNPIFFSELVSEIPEGFAEELKRSARDIFLAGGASLFRRGDPAENIYILRSGSARLVIDTGSGTGISRKTFKGESFGFPEAVLLGTHENAVEADSDCVFTAIGSNDFRRVLHLDPGLCFKLLSLLGENLNTGRQLLISLHT